MTEEEFRKAMIDEMKRLNDHLDAIDSWMEDISENFYSCVAGLGAEHDIGAIRVCEME